MHITVLLMQHVVMVWQHMAHAMLHLPAHAAAAGDGDGAGVDGVQAITRRVSARTSQPSG